MSDLDTGITLHPDSPEARRANELARELLTARSAIPGDDVWKEALGRVMDETTGRWGTGKPEEELKAMVTRVAYLVGALNVLALTAAWMAALCRKDEKDENGVPVELPKVLQDLVLLSEQIWDYWL